MKNLALMGKKERNKQANARAFVPSLEHCGSFTLRLASVKRLANEITPSLLGAESICGAKSKSSDSFLFRWNSEKHGLEKRLFFAFPLII